MTKIVKYFLVYKIYKTIKYTLDENVKYLHGYRKCLMPIYIVNKKYIMYIMMCIMLLSIQKQGFAKNFK